MASSSKQTLDSQSVDFLIDEDSKVMDEEDIGELESNEEFVEEMDKVLTETEIQPTDENSCSICLKCFKNTKSLNQHMRRHKNIVYNSGSIFLLVSKAKNIIASSKIHMSMKHNIEQYAIDDELLEKLVTYLNGVSKIKNIEVLYNKLFNDLMRNSEQYFTLEQSSSALLCKKFCEVVISYVSDQEIVADEISTKNLSQNELAGLQYLAGYTLRKVYYKVKSKNLSMASELIIAGCQPSSSSNDTYAEELSRGGLWIINDDIERVFVITEKYFCIQTASRHLREINIDEMVEKLTSFPPLLLMFDDVANNCEIEIEEVVKINTLRSILKLYLTVRSFSLAKDLVAKKKMKAASERSLRRSIKQASKNEDTK